MPGIRERTAWAGVAAEVLPTHKQTSPDHAVLRVETVLAGLDGRTLIHLDMEGSKHTLVRGARRVRILGTPFPLFVLFCSAPPVYLHVEQLNVSDTED